MATFTPISDAAELRKAFAHFPSGVVALAACFEGEDHVLIAATFNVGISLDPPLVSFAVQHSSTTWPILSRAGSIGVSILSSGQHELCKQLAAKEKQTRWNNITPERSADGAIFLADAALAFECTIHAQHPAGDHDIVLLEVKSFATSTCDPLIFHKSAFRSLAVCV